MFEKSLYDLIRGLRNHKGNEKEYIQKSLKECRVEIQGKDMDLKATALMKLIYLEMFGHDMSWAAFHVLEVMSSSKYSQKRVGYLGAVQSFRPDTEVLMLSENLLKKDMSSASLTQMSLPIITLPHIITPSLANSVLGDLLPRLNHSSPAIRKKSIVTIYRLALVYPETLRPSWPKIKERLMDDKEDPSVTAAIVNVVCELGWRRPQDFLPLAPRLFELLVDSGNNWMAIKLIKLFATLTPLEPRLVRKLLPPLTSYIQTTPAMSLLYECINGIIQGGILDSADDSQEIATLCVTKLRGMIMVEGDSNLKYVALLAFNRISQTHPQLVAQQEDVIMDCLDNPDITIRYRALDLVVGIVNSDNLSSIVSRLMRQLRSSPASLPDPNHTGGHDQPRELVPKADSDEGSTEPGSKPPTSKDQSPPLPDDYRTDVIRRIIDMCSSHNYSNLLDFDWYIDILLQLVRNSPIPFIGRDDLLSFREASSDVSQKVGDELRAVAVKVKAVRRSATTAAESIIIANFNGNLSASSAGRGALRPAVWVVGEYATYLSNPADTLTALMQISKLTTNFESLAIYIQAITKIFALISGDDGQPWTRERKTMISLLMARILHTFEPLAIHPDLEVQERAVEFSELLRLAAEASASRDTTTEGNDEDAPLFLTQAIPILFAGQELNSVATTAQRNVPVPAGLDLDQPINSSLNELLRSVNHSDVADVDEDEFGSYYHESRPVTSITSSEPAINRLALKSDDDVASYQQGTEESYLDPDIIARRRAERHEKHKDDPFYIAGSSATSGVSTPLHNILKDNNGPDLDIDAIPIMQLDLGNPGTDLVDNSITRRPTRVHQRVQVATDENIIASSNSSPNERTDSNLDSALKGRSAKGKQSLLYVDSSNIGAFSLEGDGPSQPGSLDYERQQHEEAEMAKAMREVEKLRLSMQRANERIQAAYDVPPEGTVVKKKVKKKAKVNLLADDEEEKDPVSKKKKKKIKPTEEQQPSGAEGEARIVKKKKSKRKPAIEATDAAVTGED